MLAEYYFFKIIILNQIDLIECKYISRAIYNYVREASQCWVLGEI